MMEMSVERKRKREREDNFSNTMNSVTFISRRYQAGHYTDPKNKSVIPAAGILSVNLSLEIILKRNLYRVYKMSLISRQTILLYSPVK